MTEDERAIRETIDLWLSASRRGDLDMVLGLMSDDVVFMVAGREPFGKAEFAALSAGLRKVQLEGTSEIKEIQVLGEWAFIRNYIEMAATPPGSMTVRRRGYTLTILRKEPDGRWRVARDANLLTTVSR